MPEIGGLICAMVTPMKDDCVPDRDGTRRLVDYVIAEGVQAILVLGTTGEGMVVPKDSWREILEVSVETIAGRVPVIVGTSDNGTKQTAARSRLAKEGGADAGLVMPPPVFTYDQSTLPDYYRAVYEESGLPLIAYNFFPKMTRTPVGLVTVEKLIQTHYVIGLKDSTGDLIYLQRTIALARGTSFRVYQGMAGLSLVSFLSGTHGTFSATANVSARLERDLLDAAKKGDMVAAWDCQRRQLDILSILSLPDRPIFVGVKAALAYLGMIESRMAGPYGEVSSEMMQSKGQELESRGFARVWQGTREELS